MAKDVSTRGRHDRAQIVAVVAPKGGVGKTTITMSILASARNAGLSVLGVNMDGQRSLERWAGWRLQQSIASPSAGLLPVEVRSSTVEDWRSLRQMGDVDLVVVDTPPGHGQALTAIRSICALADLILIPTSPSSLDLLEVVSFGRELGPARSAFVLNRVNRRARSFDAARLELQKVGNLCPMEIPSLESIPGGFVQGLAPSDRSDGGHGSFHGLWHYVSRALDLPEQAAHAVA